MSSRPLRILHLSDIHFTAETPHAASLNAEVGERLLDDLRAQSLKVDVVALTGDIAFSASVEEYRRARDFLDKVLEIVGPAQVLCVPGNHDVDRGVTKKQVTKALHTVLRTVPEADVGDHLVEMLSDPQSASCLLASHTRYNEELAVLHGCDISPESPYWEKELSRGSWVARVRGVSSTLVSNASDNKNLVLGVGQVASLSAAGPNCVTIVMAHHPPDWLRDGDQVIDALQARAHLHLFGHKHRQRVHRKDDSVVVVAGAVYPEKHSPDWLPTFNIVTVDFEAGADEPVRIDVEARVWDMRDRSFVPDSFRGRTSRSFRLPLLGLHQGTSDTIVYDPSGEQPDEAESLESLRDLLGSLPELAQLRLLVDAGLLEEHDSSLGRRVIDIALARVDDAQIEEALRRSCEDLRTAIGG